MLAQFSGMYPVTKKEYLEANKQGKIHPEQHELLGGKIGDFVGFIRIGINLKQAFLYLTLSVFLGFALLSMQVATLYIIAGFILPLIVLVGLFLTKWLAYKRNRTNLQKELDQGRIEDGVGTLKFGKESYHVALPNRILTMPFVSKEELNPGVSYHFYYLPRSGVVLSAEEVKHTPVAEVRAVFTETLAEANGFKVSSLDANKRGELAAEQVSRIYSQLVSPLVFIATSIGVIYYQVTRLDLDGPFSFNAFLSALRQSTTAMKIFGIIFIVLLVWGLVLFVQTLLDIAGKQVALVEGLGFRKITTSSDDDGSKNTRMYYVIDGVRFTVDRRGFLAFEDGRKYKAYFTPRRKILVNIEVVK
jgi:hypothetical protein